MSKRFLFLLINTIIVTAVSHSIGCNQPKRLESKDSIPKKTDGNQQQLITMATTTSTEASGLLDVLLPTYKRDTGIAVKVIAKGTGAALRDGQDGNVDIVFTHAREREEEFVNQGYGTKRYPVMHNAFVILGPPSDPAQIKGSSNVLQAFRNIAAKGARFVSRGDDSGTHIKEQKLWTAANVPLMVAKRQITKNGKQIEVSYHYPEGKWYDSIGQGMGKTIVYTDQKQAYTLSDYGTFVKYKYGNAQSIDLEILYQGDKALVNPYAIIPVSKEKHQHVNYKLAVQFTEWLISSRGQSLIENYRIHGQKLFYPDAIAQETN